MTDLLRFLESLPPGPLYAFIAAIAAIENFFPPVPADTAVALGAFLAGRGRLDAWTVFWLTWGANVASGAAVYLLARRFGRPFFRGRLGKRLLSEQTISHIEREYHRHGPYGIFLSRLLPVWRGMVMPFAGIVGLSAPRALIPLALASGLWYGALTYLVATLGTNLDTVLALFTRMNRALLIVALGAGVALGLWIWRRLKR
ncbi:MAG TPA: DedA family protein [Gemmatimonadales bacterium]|nr:DedA family protein [Gemmatimonadales bacterium]